MAGATCTERVLHHPRVIIEVLSDSTAAYDRGAKLPGIEPKPTPRLRARS
jgi:hypothetical protein